MRRLTVTHETIYRYGNPVWFGEHRLMFRPRDSHDLRLVESGLVIDPPAKVRWYHDVFGNSIAIASFDQSAAELRIQSTIVVDHYGLTNPVFPVEDFARTLPFGYQADEMPDLRATVERGYPDPDRLVDEWSRSFLNETGPTDTQLLLAHMTRSIRANFTYQARDLMGTQTPAETLERRSGTCRDYALLMMEAARSIGLAARSSAAICTIRPWTADPGDRTARLVQAPPTPGCRSTFPAPVGWRSIRPTALSATPTASASPWPAIRPKPFHFRDLSLAIPAVLPI